MAKFEKFETILPGVCELRPKVFSDDRGYFLETYSSEAFAEMGITDTFVQDNHSYSIQGTLRGMHYQLLNPQAKLCRVVQGAVLDVVVDIRPDSPTFRQHVTVVLSEQDRNVLYVPAGYAHGFQVMQGPAQFLYKCSAYYVPGDEYGVRWDDPELDIPWTNKTPLLSDKDAKWPNLKESAKLPRFNTK